MRLNKSGFIYTVIFLSGAAIGGELLYQHQQSDFIHSLLQFTTPKVPGRVAETKDSKESEQVVREESQRLVSLKSLENITTFTGGGTDAAQLYSILSTKIIRGKSEYETSDEYQAREAAEIKETLTGPLDAANYLIFEIKSYVEDLLEISDSKHRNYVLPFIWYNADKKYFQIYLMRGSVLHDKNYLALLLSSVESKGVYSARNAYGLTVTVTKESEEQFILSIAFPSDTSFSSFIEFPVMPEKAKQVGKDLKVVIAAKLYPPFHGVFSRTLPATIDSPREVEAVQRSIYVKPEEFWLVVKSTGEIVAKQHF